MILSERDARQTNEELFLLMDRDSDCAGGRKIDNLTDLGGMSFSNCLILIVVGEMLGPFLGIPD